MAGPALAAARAAQDTYRRDAVMLATPAQRLVMLFDRLVLDLQRAQNALEEDVPASAPIGHAQEILVELIASLRPGVWDGSEQLRALYAWANVRLVEARVQRDPAVVVAVLEVIEPLRDAWRDAAGEV
jgi:flagellar secretion chaperone FliS